MLSGNSLARRAIRKILISTGLRPPPPTPPRPGLMVRHQVVPGSPARPEGAHETGYADREELFLKVAHAFEGSPDVRRTRYQPIARLIRRGDRVLDVGCGDGTFLELVRERGAFGTGVDLDPAKVAECAARGLEAHCCRVQDIASVISGPLDFVSMIHIIEHVSPADALEILDCVVRSLSPDGRIFMVTPNISHPLVPASFWLDVTHTRPYPEALLNSIVAALGFPYFQSGEMTYGLETWSYAFRNPEHAFRDPDSRAAEGSTVEAQARG